MNVMIPQTASEQALGVSLPHRGLEDWKWTDLRQRITQAYETQKSELLETLIKQLVESSPFSNKIVDRLVFINGCYHAFGALPPSIKLQQSTRSSHGGDSIKSDPLFALNDKLLSDNASNSDYEILINSDRSDQPLELIFITSAGQERLGGPQSQIQERLGGSQSQIQKPAAWASRQHIILEKYAKATIIETYLGQGTYLANPFLSYDLREGAELERIKLEMESPHAVHLGLHECNLGKGSRLREISLHIGAGLARQNGIYNLIGEHADAKIFGAYLLSKKQHVDSCLRINHQVPNGTSRELFKCVMDEEARGIFQGKVIVQRYAQKTDGKQSSHGLLLSPNAEFDIKPELEIYADDVMCGHGATSGQLNEEHLFYLRARGIPHHQARSMLITAFIEETFEVIHHEEMRNILNRLVEERLGEPQSEAPNKADRLVV